MYIEYEEMLTIVSLMFAHGLLAGAVIGFVARQAILVLRGNK